LRLLVVMTGPASGFPCTSALTVNARDNATIRPMVKLAMKAGGMAVGSEDLGIWAGMTHTSITIPKDERVKPVNASVLRFIVLPRFAVIVLNLVGFEGPDYF
jgi:hypothetical protein